MDIVALVDQVEVAEDAVEHQRQRINQGIAAETFHRVVVDRVKRVGHHGRSGHHVDHLIEKGRAVMPKHRPMFGGAFPQQHDFVATFGEDQQQGQEDRTQEQPLRDLDVDRRRARHHPEHVTARNRHHVEDDDFFEHARIEQVDGEVDGEVDDELVTQVERCTERRQRKQDGGDRRYPNRQSSRSDRTVFFQRVAAVFLAVAQVVDQVDAARGEAEGEEGDAGLDEEIDISQVLGKNQRRQDENVLDPLNGSEGTKERSDHGA